MYKNIFLFLLIIFLVSSNVYSNPLSKLFKAAPTFTINNTLNNVEQKIINAGTKAFIAGRKVVINKKIFKKDTRDALGRSNCQRMSEGLSPIGIDGEPISLHHLQQENNGVIIEMLDSEHRYNSKELHSYKTTSEIDRKDFNNWKNSYWKERGIKICK